MHPELEKLLKKEWYTQGFAAKPLFLTIIASVDIMHKRLGFTYEILASSYKSDYCTFYYLAKDLSKHADIILKELDKNPSYLEEKRKLYKDEVDSFENDFKNAESDLSILSEKDLFALLKRLEIAIEATAGLAHLIEGISLRLGDMIRELLGRKTSGKTLNEDFSILTNPTKMSFLSRKEEALWKIKNATIEERKKMAKQFILDFFWVNSNYTGSSALTMADVISEAKKVERFKHVNFDTLKKKKTSLFEKHGFSDTEKKWVVWIDFLTDWQDERKKNIFRGIFAIDQVLREISKRYKIDLKFLHYLLPREIDSLSLKSKSAEKIAKKRIKGCVFIRKLDEIKVFDGKDFTEFEKAIQVQHKDIDILTGIAASLGNATGYAKICTNIESLAKVNEGDILVASMTRPEFVPAMKKAAAIVTDEGGITSHAAIVSRELGIPCVIATKNATKVLKDGWLVQVKANHGQVLVLEKR